MSEEIKSNDSTQNTESRANFANNESSSNYTNQDETSTVKNSTNNNLLKITVIAIAVATFLAGFTLANNLNDSEAEITREDIRVLEEKIENLKAPTASPQPAQAAQPTQPEIFKISLDDDPVKGDPNAPITIVEFSDFQCPFCSRFVVQTLGELEKNYIDTGKVKLVYRDLPLDNLHSNARAAHIAAECADEQGKFWEYHDILFENQGQWSRLATGELDNSLVKYSQELGLDISSFETCLISDEIANEVNKDALEARSYGASGTPTFFIGTEKDGFTKLVGAQPYSSFKQVIDSQLG